jgi:hypothetical protein
MSWTPTSLSFAKGASEKHRRSTLATVPIWADLKGFNVDIHPPLCSALQLVLRRVSAEAGWQAAPV